MQFRLSSPKQEVKHYVPRYTNLLIIFENRSRVSSVSTVTVPRAGRSGFAAEAGIFFLLPHPHRSPPSHQPNGQRGHPCRGQSGRGMKTTTHLHPTPRPRTRGAIPPLPHTSSWRGTWLSTGTTLPYKEKLPQQWKG
jgi:hypothetical protein